LIFSFIEPELWATEVYIAGIGILTILLLWPWPWPDDLRIRTWPIFPGDIPDVQILRQGFWNLSSDIHTYIHTYAPWFF